MLDNLEGSNNKTKKNQTFGLIVRTQFSHWKGVFMACERDLLYPMQFLELFTLKNTSWVK